MTSFFMNDVCRYITISQVDILVEIIFRGVDGLAYLSSDHLTGWLVDVELCTLDIIRMFDFKN